MLDSSSSTSFLHTWETPHKPPDEKIQATSGTVETDVTGIPDLPLLPEMFHDEYDAADGSDNSSQFAGA